MLVSSEQSGARVAQHRSNAEMVRQRRAPAPTGEVLNRGGAFAVCLGRSFRVGPDVVWEWLTDPARMRIWLGETDPEQHLFRLAGGTVDAPQLCYEIEALERPERIALSLRDQTSSPGSVWRLDIRLTATPGGTHLMLEQSISDRVAAPSVAAACEFFLDRLVRVCHGEPFTDLDHDDYFLSQGPTYRRMFPLPHAQRGR